MKEFKVLGVIPARLASSRLYGKLLMEIRGKSVLQRVYEQSLKAKSLNQVIIATDHSTILNHATSFGANAILSKREHTSGTDRIAELAETFPEYSRIINIQGDEPFIDPGNIDFLVDLMIEKNCEIATLAINQTGIDSIDNPNFVKLVVDNEGHALYFSRATIPFLRDQQLNMQFQWKRHIGIYGFKRGTLLEITKLPPSSLEQIECLEQLRWLENGYRIQIGNVSQHANGIDTIEDLNNAIRFAMVNNL